LFESVFFKALGVILGCGSNPEGFSLVNKNKKMRCDGLTTNLTTIIVENPPLHVGKKQRDRLWGVFEVLFKPNTQ
jgi:hypothetical protein